MIPVSMVLKRILSVPMASIPMGITWRRVGVESRKIVILLEPRSVVVYPVLAVIIRVIVVVIVRLLIIPEGDN